MQFDPPQSELSLFVKIKIFCRLIRFETIRAFKNPGDFLIPVGYFLILTLIFPILSSPTFNALPEITAGVIWLSLSAAALPAAESVFVKDIRSGAADFYLYSPLGTAGVFAAKALTLYLLYLIPILLCLPITAILYGISALKALQIASGIVTGSLAVAFFGALGGVLSAGAGRGGLFSFLLVAPLLLPALIFGAACGSTQSVADFYNILRLSAGFSLFSGIVSVFAGGKTLETIIHDR